MPSAVPCQQAGQPRTDPTREGAIDVDGFVTAFQGSVRALLDWDGIRAGAFRVTELYSRSPERLGELWTCWYTTAAGGRASYDTPGARPLSVREALDVTWDADRSIRISSLMAGYQADDQPAQLVLPGVRGADGAIVLADGNHRACAAYAAKVDLRLFLFVIDGPADERTLPDLIHHAGRAG